MLHAHSMSDSPVQAGCLYLPVASKTSYRLADESDTRPLQAVSPVQAYADFQRILGAGRVRVTGVRGPGDALADAANTLAFLHMVRAGHPEVQTCLTTIGLGGQDWAGELGRLGLSRVTLLVDTVSLAAADKLYAWIRPGTKTLPRTAALPLLLEQQAEAVAAFVSVGVAVDILTTVRPGVNDHEVGIIARKMAALGAESMRVSLAEGLDDPELLARLRAEAAEFLSETLDEPALEAGAGALAAVPKRPIPGGTRPFVAVTSSDAMEVDLHLGQAPQFLVYGPKNGTVGLIGTRPAPAPGSGAARWEGVAEILSDCAYLLTASAGQKPREALEITGLRVLVAEGGVDGMVDGLYGGGKKPRKH